MRIYSDTLTTHEIHLAWQDARPETEGAYMEELHTVTENGRRRKRTHSLTLGGSGARHTRKRNTGQHGADGEIAATWMDWGWLIAVLFRYEPTAVIGQYDGQSDFLEQTRRAIPHRLRVDASVRNFASRHASWWPTDYMEHRLFSDTGQYTPVPATSPFLLVDRVCPPSHLITLHPPAALEAWLNHGEDVA